jgi:NAD(P)-dependent dehydrogenase (short-subunit alcohol dehydrogenase family)
VEDNMKKDRVVLITGAAGGVGRVLVDRFLVNEDTVIATDRAAEALSSLSATRPGPKLFTVPVDISKEDDCARLADVARERAGRVDVLINCAGFFPIRAFEEMTPAEWRQVIDINLTGPYLVTRAVLPLMKGKGWGRMINFSSASIFEGVPGQTHYVAAKAGLVGFSRSLAREVGTYGITVNLVSPGLTVTSAVKSSFPAEVIDAQRNARAIKRDEVPEDLVGAVFFLASPDADFLSGQTLNVDGGKTMR